MRSHFQLSLFLFLQDHLFLLALQDFCSALHLADEMVNQKMIGSRKTLRIRLRKKNWSWRMSKMRILMNEETKNYGILGHLELQYFELVL